MDALHMNKIAVRSANADQMSKHICTNKLCVFVVVVFWLVFLCIFLIFCFSFYFVYLLFSYSASKFLFTMKFPRILRDSIDPFSNVHLSFSHSSVLLLLFPFFVVAVFIQICVNTTIQALNRLSDCYEIDVEILQR